MPFHLILPGLLWPHQALRDTAHDLPLPSLSWLLGRARLQWQAPLPLENWLCHEFGCAPDRHRPPAAALRLLGEGAGLAPGADIWLCADPVHLRIEQGRARLLGGELNIAGEEMAQLAAALAPLFDELGEFRIGAQAHGYLRLSAMPRLLTPPPSAAAGRGSLLPTGADAAHWLRLGNEAQMLLHGLPLNKQREAEGRPALNSLWFWGAGSLPARTDVAAAGYRSLIGDHALLGGLANWAGIAHHSSAPDPLSLLREASLLLLDELQTPAQALDANAWRTALVELERGWLAPLRGALASGRLDSLRITGLGDEAGVDITLTRADALKFWRRPLPLHQLTYPKASLP